MNSKLIVNDIELGSSNNETINQITEFECVICLNKIINEPNDFKFSCGHKKYIHNECITNLDKCPLCRQLSNYGYFQNFIESIQNKILFILKLLYFPISFAIIYLILKFITT